jgi:hypothetical protein
MSTRSEKDRLAEEAMGFWHDFQAALSPKKKFPMQQFRAFWKSAKRYAEYTKSDSEIHRELASAVHELVTTIGWAGKSVQDGVLWEIQRLECLVFDGYDPHFEGDEPPGL